MISKLKIALATVLVVASASSAFAANTKKATRTPARAVVTEGRNSAAAAPISEAEKRWMERASLPSTY